VSGDRGGLRLRVPEGEAGLAGNANSGEEARVAARLSEACALFGRSLHIRTIDTGSCAVCESEVRLLLAPHYDLHRLGLFFTPAPRHADMLMVTGPAVRAMGTAVQKTYEAMPEPKVVMAVGACPLGGVYPEDELVHGSLERVLTVDVFVPGCPPSPLALLQGLLVAVGRLSEKVSRESFVDSGPSAGGRWP
jgi:Ni,Fe-hydrogenase III small subunit